MGMETIEEHARDFSGSRKKLCDSIKKMQDELEKVKRKHLPIIKALAGSMAVDHERLFQEIDENRVLFVKPKTQTISGIRVGLKKEKGKTTIPDEAATIKLIKHLLPNQVKLLIQTEERILKTPLLQLPGETLKRVGVEVGSDTDAVFIKPVGDDIDKLVAALLAEAEEILKEVA